MKTIVAGSRSIGWEFRDEIFKTLDDLAITTVISGRADGVDRIGESWADSRGVELVQEPAHWLRYGRAAGPIRNEKMAEQADQLVAFWDGKSRGTEHMIRTARDKGLAVVVKVLEVSP